MKSNLKAATITFGFLAVTLGLTLIAVTLRHRGTPSLLANNIVVLTLFNVNLILLAVLILLLTRNLIKLLFEWRQNILGARFQTKLVVAFVGFSLIPTVLLFIVASGLLSRGIDNWFNLQVEKSLNRSLDVAQMYYQKVREDTLALASDLGRDFGGSPLTAADFPLESRIAEQVKNKMAFYPLSGIEVYRSDGKRLARHLRPGTPSRSFPWLDRSGREKGLRGERFTVIRPLGGGDLVAAIAPLAGKPEGQRPGFVVVYTAIPPEAVGKMQEITRSFEEYHQVSALKNPIKRSYLLSFLAITLLILFSATWFGYYLARGITIPIQKMAEGTRSVAQGDLDFKIDVQATDEIGVLVAAFNKMTEDLKQGKLKLEEVNRSLRDSNIELDREKNTMETVLENITTGLISLDRKGNVVTLNQSAEKILGFSRDIIQGKSFNEIFHHVPLGVGKQIMKKMREGSGTLTEEEIQFELNNRLVTLRLNMATLYDEKKDYLGMVVAFDDISELIKAQRVAAWQEVAQRIAHEIKNPLTPIQLCTQRLRKKYYEQAPDYDRIFDECTQTIIQEVNSLKTLLNEFSQFARMPMAHPAPLVFHDVLGEVVRLYRAAHREIDILEDLSGSVPQVQADREQIKRMLINLFENAVEAMGGKGRIWVKTSYEEAGNRFRLELADEGAGIPPEDKSRLFVPYFSRKKSGTGLGLAIVHRIVSDHHGVIRVSDNLPKGTKFLIDLPVTGGNGDKVQQPT